MKTIVMLGNGGAAEEIRDWFQHVLAEDETLLDGYIGLPGPLYWISTPENYNPVPGQLVIAGIGKRSLRIRLCEVMDQRGVRWARAVAENAEVSARSIIGIGAVICPFAYVPPKCDVGRLAYLNIGVVLGRGAAVGDLSVLAPHSQVLDNAKIGRGVFLGAGAIVLPGVTVGDGVTVAAGVVVDKDVASGIVRRPTSA